MDDFRDRILEAQGTLCLIPGCGQPWTDRAHIQPSGMGGRPSMWRADNLVGLCHEHHMVFDGHDLKGRQTMLRLLMQSRRDQLILLRGMFTPNLEATT